MDPSTLIASLQQSGAQFTPAQIQQIQSQLQQQQQQPQQPQQQNDAATSGPNNNVPQQPMPNVPNMNHFFPAPTMALPQQTSVTPVNGATNQAPNAAFPFALLGASPLQQQLAALSGFPQIQQQQQQQLMTNSNDPNSLHPKPQAPNAVPILPVQQQQPMQAWNPQQLQLQPQPQQPFVNPFIPALMPMQLQQQLQQQFLAQQMMQLGGGGGMAGGNAMAANHLLAALLASQQQASPQSQQHPGVANSLPSFPAPTPSDTPKGLSDGKGGEVEWTKPFAGKVKKESPFPMKLYQILSNPECQECICWNPHGRSWRILKPPVFEQVVIPLYFRHAKYASFMRQVNGWGFKRVVTGSDHNSYYHEYFVRDNPQLCLQMKRIKKKDGDFSGGRRDDDGSEDEEGAPVEKVEGDNDNKRLDNATLMPPAHPPIAALPTQSPNDLMQFAGMAGLNAALNPANAAALNGGAVSQPNFLMNGMLPAAALLAANPQAALLNGVHPFVMPGFPAAMPDGSLPMIPGMPMPASNQPASQTTPIANNATTSQPPSQMVHNLTNAFSGMDSETLAKLQEIVNSGGTDSLLQHLQQQQQPVGSEKTAGAEVKIEEGPNPEEDADKEEEEEEDDDGDTYEA